MGIGSFGGEQIYTVNVDGTGLTRLTGPSTGDVVTAGDFYTRDSPNWAPNGSKIAFVRFGPCSAQSCLVEDADYDVLVMNADGRGNKRLTDNLVHDLEPAWSPNGRRIVFERAGDLGGIWRMRPDGSYQTKLTSGGQSPDWQPLP